MSVSSATSAASSSAGACARPNSTAKARWNTEATALPVHRRNPRVERLALVDPAADAVGQLLCVRAGGLDLDHRRGRAAVVHQLDGLHGCEGREGVADALLVDVVGQVADHDAHGVLLIP